LTNKKPLSTEHINPIVVQLVATRVLNTLTALFPPQTKAKTISHRHQSW